MELVGKAISAGRGGAVLTPTRDQLLSSHVSCSFFSVATAGCKTSHVRPVRSICSARLISSKFQVMQTACAAYGSSSANQEARSSAAPYCTDVGWRCGKLTENVRLRSLSLEPPQNIHTISDRFSSGSRSSNQNWIDAIPPWRRKHFSPWFCFVAIGGYWWLNVTAKTQWGFSAASSKGSLWHPVCPCEILWVPFKDLCIEMQQI